MLIVVVYCEKILRELHLQLKEIGPKFSTTKIVRKRFRKIYEHLYTSICIHSIMLAFLDSQVRASYIIHTLEATSAASSLELKFSSSYSISLRKNIYLLKVVFHSKRSI